MSGGMDFDQAATVHHFRLAPDGGSIEVETRRADDTALRDMVRAHLRTLPKDFAAGDFAKPFATHGETPDGVPDLIRLKNRITYSFETLKEGGRVRIGAVTPEAIEAVPRIPALPNPRAPHRRHHNGVEVIYALRGLRRTTPGVTASCVLTLSLGIGAAAAVFAVVYGVLLRPLPFADPGTLIQLNGVTTGGLQNFSLAELDDWKARTRTLSHVAGFSRPSSQSRMARRPLLCPGPSCPPISSRPWARRCCSTGPRPATTWRLRS